MESRFISRSSSLVRWMCVSFLLWGTGFLSTPTSWGQTRTEPPKTAPTAAASRTRPKPRPRTRTVKGNQSAASIVDRAVVAMGGVQAIQAVRSILAHGKVTLVTPLGEQTGKVVSYSIKPGYQRVDILIGQSRITQTFHPGGGWFQQGSSVFTPPQAMLELAKEQEARIDLELRFRKEKIRVQRTGTRKIRERACWIIVFRDRSKRLTTYYIDKKTHHVLKRTFVGPSPLGQGKSRFSTHQSNFKTIVLPNSPHKIHHAFRVEDYMDGKKLGVIEFTSIVLNSPKVTQALFHRPRPVD